MIGFTAEQIREIVERLYTGTASETDESRFYRLSALPNFIECVAIMEAELAGLSLPLIDRLWGGAIIATWERWEPAVEYVRSQPHAEKVFVNFEVLARRLAERRTGA